MSVASSANAPENVVLLAAGRGSRLAELTERTHKSLLPLAGKPALQYVVDEVLARPVGDVVIVTGYMHEAIERFVRDRYAGRVRAAFNSRFAEDTNILSTETGVAALARPEKGYLIVETDLIVAPEGWASMFDVGRGDESFWVTRGHYSASLTGGALQVDAEGRVTDLVYAPKYDAVYDGYQKLLGVLYVGRDQVASDRELRKRAMQRTIAQYYMTPWVENIASLPCRARSLGETFAASYNDLEAYRETDRNFTEVLRRAGRAA